MAQGLDSLDGKPKPATRATQQMNEAVKAGLPFDDERDFADARKGFVGSYDTPDGTLRSPDGSVFWSFSAYAFLLQHEAPDTVNPSLWRMARLNMIHGLFKVVERVYQVRGLDLANLTIIEGDSGLILIDPLTTAEAARAALELYYLHRPRRPVVAVIYSHSHVDHYGGVKGVIDDAQVQAGKVAVIAPSGFMEGVAGENVLVGNPMSRRGQFQFGRLLAKGPQGQVDAGLGKVTAGGSITLIAPTQEICEPVETHVIDGVEMVFHLAPGTEAPAEMHMFMPGFGVLNMAENACRLLHNFCPLRGALVRDPRIWSHYLSDAMERFGPGTEVLIGQHHWPTWGREQILEFLADQRDLYKYVHDQTVRLMNHGCKPAEISERLELPPGLASQWGMRGYYGTVSHNAKAVYQRYLSWYDGNPANLNPLPPVPTALKTMAYMGGIDRAVEMARADFAEGNYRWVAQVMGQAVFADAAHEGARHLLADAFEQLGYQAESSTWRNAYLYGAQELRQGVIQLPRRPFLSPDLLQAVTPATMLDLMAVRLNPARLGERRCVINWHFEDAGEHLAMTLSNSTLTHVAGKVETRAEASVRTTLAALARLSMGQVSVAAALAGGEIGIEGDQGLIEALFGGLDDFPMMFNVVTPEPGPAA
ncbi:alkyl/aryl-sulfatase [Comamonas composti]|uniref:alkyl/aryl-sulfatase n=1 Tax=Comamonas composti TaxID=408558 RepID=UPI0004043595|nr:alkyl sulfatase dimerization domain-containing protein [Comamonas composti]